MTALDYESVSRYWNTADASILGPYMMDGFGFPPGAGRFRFRAECRIVDHLVRKADRNGCVLDLGSGIGFWTEYFARQFSRVVSIEASESLYEALEQRCAPYPNAKTICGDVMTFQPEDQYAVIFLGGLLMYLNEEDVIFLMKKLIPSLQPGGVILCRESTVRKGTMTRQGEYQAVYRSVANYNRIFAECGLSVSSTEINAPYVLMQMGCELVKKWKALMPASLHGLPVMGPLVYWGLRLGYPWITRVPATLGLAYPELTNHFFSLRPGFQRTSARATSDSATGEHSA